eukprot:GHVU01011092.1.p1 GENE.GHVU01011092.1~~GHVU01011092.1.p1  ORF type:complete len:417 (+),score=47.37 GHVU01011092.1:303-1553(+)
MQGPHLQISAGQVSSRWTPRPASARKVNVPPPSSDSYSDWTPDQVKAECTSRKLRLPATTPTALRRAKLEEDDANRLHLANAITATRSDAAHLTLGSDGRLASTFAAEGVGAGTTGAAAAGSSAAAADTISSAADGKVEPPPKRRSAHCIPRLLNTLLGHDDLREKLIRSGDQLTWQQLGSRTQQTFWYAVAERYNDRTPSIRDEVINGCDGISSNAFAGIDPSKAHEWPPQKLHDLFRDVNSRYTTALSHFKKSGNHDPDFSKVRCAQADVVYLWCWLQQYPDALSFMRGGMPEGSGIDTVGSQLDAHASSTAASTRPHKASRVSSANRVNNDGDSYNSIIASAITNLCSQSSTTHEAEIQSVLNGVVEKVASLHAQWKQETDEKAAKELEDMLKYYRDRQTKLIARLNTIEGQP